MTDKTPPHDRDLEAVVLGAMLLERNALVMNSENLTTELFYVSKNQLVAEAIISLYSNSEPVDILTVAQKLKDIGQLKQVGAAYITKLTNRVGSAANVDHHIKILQQLQLRRDIIRISTNNIRSAYDETEDVLANVEEFQQSAVDLSGVIERKKTASINMQVMSARDQIDNAVDKRQKGEITGIQSGFAGEDSITGGMRGPDLIVMAARPGMGKTAHALKRAWHVAKYLNQAVAVFSLEMSAEQLVMRIASMEAEVSVEMMNKGSLTSEQHDKVNSALAEIANSKMIIDDTPAITMFELKAKARRMKLKHDIQLIVLDYVQLACASRSWKGNREQEISTISRSCKEIAKDLNVPFVALSQLSRGVESRPDKKPILSDLRESGAIEQDADIVMFIWRPDYYGITHDEANNDITGLAKVIIAKHRSGRLDNYNLRFIGQYTKFVEWEDNPSPMKQLEANGDFDNPPEEDGARF